MLFVQGHLRGRYVTDDFCAVRFVKYACNLLSVKSGTRRQLPVDGVVIDATESICTNLCPEAPLNVVNVPKYVVICIICTSPSM